MQSVSRIFSILNIISQHPEGIGVLDIGKQIGLAKSTTSRFLKALEDEGAVRREGRKFFIGSTVSNLFSHYQSPREVLIGRLRPYLQQLCNQTGETILLAFLDGETVSHNLTLQSPQTIQLQLWDPTGLPLHVTAEGKLFLAFASASVQEAYIKNRPFRPHTDNSIIDKTIMQQELAKIREQAFAVTDEEFADDVFGIAVPIYGELGTVESAACFYCPRFRIAGRTMVEDVVEKMNAALSKAL